MHLLESSLSSQWIFLFSLSVLRIFVFTVNSSLFGSKLWAELLQYVPPPDMRLTPCIQRRHVSNELIIFSLSPLVVGRAFVCIDSCRNHFNQNRYQRPKGYCIHVWVCPAHASSQWFSVFPLLFLISYYYSFFIISFLCMYTWVGLAQNSSLGYAADCQWCSLQGLAGFKL